MAEVGEEAGHLCRVGDTEFQQEAEHTPFHKEEEDMAFLEIQEAVGMAYREEAEACHVEAEAYRVEAVGDQQKEKAFQQAEKAPQQEAMAFH